MADDESAIILQAGARVILNLGPAASPMMALLCGLQLEPGEDFLSAMARSRGVDRSIVEDYFRALAAGNSIQDSHMLAAPAAGPVQ
jgi:hypothetical protein